MTKLIACIVLGAAAAMLPAQGSSAPKNAKPVAAKPLAAAPAQGAGHASLAALQRDFQEKKVAALDALAREACEPPLDPARLPLA